MNQPIHGQDILELQVRVGARRRDVSVIFSVMDDHETHLKAAAMGNDDAWCIGVFNTIILTLSFNFSSWISCARDGFWGGQVVNFCLFLSEFF